MHYPTLLHDPSHNAECIIEFTAPRCGTIVQEISRERTFYVGTSERIGYCSNRWNDSTGVWHPVPIELLRNCDYAIKHYPELFI